MQNSHKPVFRVGEYIDYLNTFLDLQTYTLQGEVSDLSFRGNTAFFTLCDIEEEAKIECVLWKSIYDKLDFNFEEGLEVQLTGRANIYKPRGKLSFVVNKINPVGEGALQKAFENLKIRLENEGYFSEENKKPIPEYINSIGLITSEQGDAKKDFLTHLKNFGFKIYFYDVRVEGIQSVESIVEAIRYFNENPVTQIPSSGNLKFPLIKGESERSEQGDVIKSLPLTGTPFKKGDFKNKAVSTTIDVIVLTRGGGSLESLQSFNSEEVAKAIYSSKIPVICGVGHENDITIADLVADMRASTPTHAGRIISEPWSRVEQKILECAKGIMYGFEEKCKYLSSKFYEYEKYFVKRLDQKLAGMLKRIYDIDSNMESKYKQLFEKINVLQQNLNYNFSIYSKKIESTENEINIHNNYLNQEFTKWFNFLVNKLEYNENNLTTSDPNLKLKQGYSITRNEKGKIIKSSQDVKIGETLNTALGNGKVISRIEILNNKL